MDAFAYIQTENFLRSVLDSAKFSRGLVPVELLQNSVELAKFLRGAVSVNHVSGSPDPGSPLDLCYRNGWLQAELVRGSTPESSSRTVYVFSSPLHRR